MEGEDENTTDERALNNKKPYIRLIILVAGAFMNILLGFILIFSLTIGTAETVVPKVNSVTEGGAAEAAGLQDNDVILRANGKRVHIIEDLSWAMSNNSRENKELQLEVKNGGEKRTVSIVPETSNGKSSDRILLKTEQNGLFQTLRNSRYKTGFYSGVIIDSFISMIKATFRSLQISGPVGIVSEIGKCGGRNPHHRLGGLSKSALP